MVGVDDIADQAMAEDHDPADHQKGLPGPTPQEVAEADGKRPDDQRQVGDESEPAIGGERFQPDIVLVFPEHQAELHRPQPERSYHDQQEAELVALQAHDMVAAIYLSGFRSSGEETGDLE